MRGDEGWGLGGKEVWDPIGYPAPWDPTVLVAVGIVVEIVVVEMVVEIVVVGWRIVYLGLGIGMWTTGGFRGLRGWSETGDEGIDSLQCFSGGRCR